jgi:hypothetical protein
MNYLQVVNNVLRRMRENEVSTVTENTYSTMVGDFVNDAYRLIKDSWDWSSLRQNIAIATSAGVASYALTGSDFSLKVFTIIDTGTGEFLTYKPQAWFTQKYNQPIVEGRPTYFTFDGETSGVPNIKLYPRPDGVYNLSVNAVVRSDELSGTDPVLVPTLPLIHMSIALLSRERGETGGPSAAELYSIADRYLGDAIALDANKHPEELVWNYI